jgi:hypothetical protein
MNNLCNETAVAFTETELANVLQETCLHLPFDDPFYDFQEDLAKTPTSQRAR